MLFAAGLGTRMRELTRERPKPLVPLLGKPLLEYALAPFECAGCRRVVVNTHYLGEQVAAYLAQRQGRVEVCLSPEPVLLETGGGVVQALPLLGDAPFVSANSDAFLLDGATPALERLARAFDAARLDAILLLHPLERAIGYNGPGNFDLTEEGLLLRSERPHYVFTGVQILHPRLFAGRKAEPFSLREVYRAAEGEDRVLRRIGGLVHEGEWIHVGTPEELAHAEAFLARP